jgi:ADP-heptose:LPS heptosyltransferase
MFSEAIARTLPESNAMDLIARYRRVREPRKYCGSDPQTVFVLSRVTLGADVAVTSVLLDAAKLRFPDSRIVLVGGGKSWELFAGDPRIDHAAVSYRRAGSLSDRLAHWSELQRLVSKPGSIVIDPDSRLTQLGLLPICPDENYFFFESRGYGGETDEPLFVLAARWAKETFDIANAGRFIAPADTAGIPGRPFVTISLGVGENPAKRIGDPFEEKLVTHISRSGAHVLIDEGAGGEEAERVARAIARSGAPAERVKSFRGRFAAFASAIAQSDLYVGYDSAGHHVAAARGVPLVCVFAGAPSKRFFARWRPTGSGEIHIIAVTDADPEQVLAETARQINGITDRWKYT